METAAELSQTRFQCRSPNATSPLGRAMALVGVGVVVGAAGWYEVDRTVSFSHIAIWLAGGGAAFAPLAWLLERNPLLEIGIDAGGLTIVRARERRTFAWGEIEAARFQDYSIAHSGGQTIRCFLLRAGGEKFELTPEFADDATREAFEEAIQRELEARDIPESSGGLPSFERILSLCGAWVFALSVIGMLAGHAMGFHTFGTIFGLAFLLTGSVIAWMTRGERLSRLVLAATLVLIVGGSAILWACGVNVREVLNKWEWTERGPGSQGSEPGK